jgi:hypothetical protein
MEFRLADLLRRIPPGGLIPLGSAESKKETNSLRLLGLGGDYKLSIFSPFPDGKEKAQSRLILSNHFFALTPHSEFRIVAILHSI